MKIMILGGDGFCGWATALHLSAQGHEVGIVDNLERRKLDEGLGVSSLTPIADPLSRIETWKVLSGELINFWKVDVARNGEGLKALLKSQKPDAVVHFAEQRAAPPSMKNASWRKYTVSQNLSATQNVLESLLAQPATLVHLGTTGVWGYHGDLEIPDGKLEVEVKGKKHQISFPFRPGSVYHATKCMDAILMDFYARNYGLSIIDLHQGIVWGTQTKETRIDDRLLNRFDYDGDWGTVLNRFILQGVVGYPLTVYGTGGQTRAFIHIQDTVKCVEKAVQEKREGYHCFNQLTEVLNVKELAEIVSQLTGTDIDFLKNPRKESFENKLFIQSGEFKGGLKLEDHLLKDSLCEAERFKGRANLGKIAPMSFWR